MMSGKTAIVTGASQGIGQSIATRLNALGYNLVLNCKSSESALDCMIESFANTESATIKVMGDVSDFGDALRLIESAYEAFGSVDALINNAGVTKDNLLALMSEADFDSVVDTNLKGTFNCCRHIAKRFMKQRYGRIVNISSVVGMAGNAGQVNYAASKAGIIGLTKSVARELAGRGILVNAIAPGFIQTAMTDKIPEKLKSEMLKNIPLGRMGTVEDIADAVEFLLSDKSSYITGQVLSVNGGFYM